jgi:hypothetical protein
MKVISGDLIRKALLILALFGLKSTSAQIYNFTSAGASGSVGPTQTELNAAYLNTNLDAKVVSNNGIQTWTVPASGPYRITAIGAQGAGNGGFGAKLEGDFNLIAGQVLQIVVGQQGENGSGANTSNNGGGGGGGSFIVIGLDSLLLAAGGGGGGILNSAGGNASTLTLGGSTIWNGAGDNGNGGHSGITNGDAAGGGGFYTDGENSYNTSQSACEGGKAFVNGASGGASGTYGVYYGGAGGFGGGGAGWHNGINRGGAGGGYSGGQGGTLSSMVGGGGGGSLNMGDDQTNIEGVGSGNGSVTILFLKALPIDIAPDGTSGLGTGFTPTNVAVTTSLSEEETTFKFNIYPNPSNGMFKVETNGDNKKQTYTVIDMSGRVIEQKISEENIVEFNISGLSNGVYYLKIGNSKVEKIVKA